MKLNFQGQTVLVTGGTRGIGKQIAADFESLDARVILTGTDPSEISKLNRSSGKKRIYQCADFENEESLSGFLKFLEVQPRIDVCINNAGINRLAGIQHISMRDWNAIQKVNVEAPLRITAVLSKKMSRRGYGRIVNIASIFGLLSREKRTPYSVSKFALRGLTVASSVELAQHNILINTVSPGFVKTDLTRQNLSKAEMKQLAAQVPMRRLAVPEDISRVVVFLASPLNTYLTGQNIIVDGGFVNV